MVVPRVLLIAFILLAGFVGPGGFASAQTAIQAEQRQRFEVKQEPGFGLETGQGKGFVQSPAKSPAKSPAQAPPVQARTQTNASLKSERALDHLTIYVPGNLEGGFDITSQSMRNALLSARLVEDVDIVHLPGAGGLIAIANFIEAQKGNGQAVLVGGKTNLGATIFNNSPVSLSNTVPVVRLTNTAIVIAVNHDSPIRDFSDLAEAMSRQPAKLRWIGGSSASVDEMLVMEIADGLGLPRQSFRYIPTPGAGTVAIDSFLGQSNAISVSSFEEIARYVAQNKVRIIATSGKARISDINAPTLQEFGLELPSRDWRGIFAPPGISTGARGRLEDLFARMVTSDSWIADAKRYGWQNAWLVGDGFTGFLDQEFQSVSLYSDGRDAQTTSSAGTLRSILSRQYRWTIYAALTAILLGLTVLWQRYASSVREHNLTDSLDAARQQAEQAEAELEKALGGATANINQQFLEWKLTPAEVEIGWMLLKGLSFKEIALVREKSERTVRQQARAIYAKSGLGNRSDLSAFFLEDFFSEPG